MTGVTVLIVEKSGNIKELTIKSFDENELYKKAGHSSITGFKCYTQWEIKDLDEKSYNISVFGKIAGRANQENKFEFPPPIDNTLFFGNCLIVNYKNNVPVSLSSDEWDSIYEHLYGGFEDIGDDDSDDEDESEDNDLPLTKNGYAKDGFVVDDENDESYEEESEEETSEEDDECTKKKSTAKKSKAKIIAKPKIVVEKKTKKNDKSEKPLANIFTSVAELSDNYLDCTNELSEEPYI